MPSLSRFAELIDQAVAGASRLLRIMQCDPQLACRRHGHRAATIDDPRFLHASEHHIRSRTPSDVRNTTPQPLQSLKTTSMSPKRKTD
jgi:hypothetical protein